MDKAEAKIQGNMKKTVTADVDLDTLAKAVTAQESGGKATAVSDKGAQGLMQLMPATGKELAQKAGVKYDPFDAKQNQMLGTMYLKELLTKYDGDKHLALAAYNWGMGNIDKLIKRVGSKRFEDLKPFLPDETAKYVPSVLKRESKLMEV